MHPKDVLYVSNTSLNEIYIPLNSWSMNISGTLNLLSQLKQDIKNLHILNTQDIFCNKLSNKCTVYSKPNLLYLDRVHLSIEGGNLVTKRLFQFIDSFEQK